MIKGPIEVAIDNRDETMNPMSRLNFGKIYIVDHDVKVLPVGRVTSRSMMRFIQYARDGMRQV